jgi:hypothetical protein
MPVMKAKTHPNNSSPVRFLESMAHMKSSTSNVLLQQSEICRVLLGLCHHLIYCVRLGSLRKNIYLPHIQSPVLEFRPLEFH